MSKKQQSSSSARAAGSLAEQLKRLELKPAPSAGAATLSPAKPAAGGQAPKSSTLAPPPAPLNEALEEDELDEQVLFQKALNSLSRREVFQGKFDGAVPSLPKAPHTAKPPKAVGPAAAPEAPAEPSPEEEALRQQVLERREEALFERLVGEVAPVSGAGKYRPHVPRPVEREDTLEARAAFAPTPGAYSSGPPRDTSDLSHGQRELLKRVAREGIAQPIPQLNLRGDTLEDALRQLELFVHQKWKDRERYVRVIHGRGVHSEGGEPVLKPAVRTWLDGPGDRYVRAWAPELQPHGDYGSLVVELKRPQSKAF